MEARHSVWSPSIGHPTAPDIPVFPMASQHNAFFILRLDELILACLMVTWAPLVCFRN